MTEHARRRPGDGAGGPAGDGSALRVGIERLLEPTAEHVAALGRLLPQLSGVTPPDIEDLRRICDDRRVVLLLARLHGELVGSLTLVLFELLTGMRAWIEDVVVEGSHRGAGIGIALVEEALLLAGAAGARSVDLTSRPAREAANRLYARAGFERRETNVWRYSVRGSGGNRPE